MGKKKIINGISYFKQKAYSECMKNQEADFLFALTAIKELIKENEDKKGKIDPTVTDFLNNVPVLLSNPSTALYAAKVKYFRLSEQERAQLESIPELKAGKYDLLKSVEALGLM